jgi:outer membrane receptor protein involved in Fe transport
MGGPLLIANTSYYTRGGTELDDGSVFDASLFGLTTPTGPMVPGVADWNSYDYVLSRQNTFSQEVRLQSDSTRRFRWLVGGFYERNRQYNLETFHAPELPLLTQNLFGAGVADVFGENLLPPDIGYVGLLNSQDSQLAAFSEFNYDILKELTLTVGVRKSQSKFNFDTRRDGPYNGGPTAGTGNTSESPVTPKYSVSYRPSDTDLIYATVAKGFRTGGANLPVPSSLCGADLAALGLGAPPTTYKSDGLWSYEVGAKDKLFDSRVEISSSIYRIDWTQIQQKVPLLNCGFSLITNLGSARSEGFDLQAQLHPFENFAAGVAVGYDQAKFTNSVKLSGNVNLVTLGDRLPVSPWTTTVTADYRWPMPGGHDAYLHLEDRFASKYPNLIAQDPANTSYDATAYHRPSTNLVLLRAGMLINNFDCSIFANNVFNSHTTIARDHDTVSSPTFFLQNVQPRVIGVTFTYRR